MALLADTSIWVDHLRGGLPALQDALMDNEIVCHPFIIGEIALGSLKDRETVLGLLSGLPQLDMAEPSDIRHMIDAKGLYSRGIGYVDAALIASALIRPRVRIWTKDKRLSAVAEELGIGR